MKIRGFLQDLGGAGRVGKARRKSFQDASPKPILDDPIGDVARALHHGYQEVEITSIRPASPTSKTITFKSKTHIPYFQAGQFLTLKTKIGNSLVTRPYSISSAPYQAKEEGIVEITVQSSKGGTGFFGEFLYKNAKIGDFFEANIGLGNFYHDPIRDSHDVLALAGGSGITPFLSMAREIKHGDLDVDLTVLFGSDNQKDIILKDELESCACDKVKIIHVLSGNNPGWKGEKGFIGHDLIKKYAKADSSIFVCGPQAMYHFVNAELFKMKWPKNRIRLEVFGSVADPRVFPNFPKEKYENIYKITVRRGLREDVIPGKAGESILTALERAGIYLESSCRSGACGFCRSKLISGDLYISAIGSGRRMADKDFSYFHACCAFPLSDCVIKIPIAE